jgi:uncharacterized OB-fold protein
MADEDLRTTLPAMAWLLIYREGPLDSAALCERLGLGPTDLEAILTDLEREGRVQRDPATGAFQWPPQWIGQDSHSFDLDWVDVEPRGVIYSWERVWHPVHPVLAEACPYVVVLVELPHADGVRMVGNLHGDPTAPVPIGAEVDAVFEDHFDGEPPYTLVQWQLGEASPACDSG